MYRRIVCLITTRQIRFDIGWLEKTSHKRNATGSVTEKSFDVFQSVLYYK